MKKRTFLIGLGLITFATTLIIKTPVAVIAKPLDSTLKVKMINPKGSIWNGTVSAIKIGKTRLGKTKWQIKALPLLSGSISADLQTRNDDIEFDGMVSYSLGSKAINVTDASVLAEASALAKFNPLWQLTGKIQSSIQYLTWEDYDNIPTVDAVVNWQGAPALIPMKDGFYTADIKHQAASNDKKEQLIATLSSKESPIDVSGTATLNSNWRFNTDIRLKGNESTSDSTLKMIKMAGKEDETGAIALEYKGSLRNKSASKKNKQ